MADGIKVSTQVLLETAGTIRGKNEAMDTKLKDINGKMNALEANWQSDTSTEIRNAMNALKPRFEDYRSVVDAYAKFLDNTAQSYDVTENTALNNAGQFK